MKYGVFISYRHTDWALAGRVYDYLKAKGYQPFLDTRLEMGEEYRKMLERHIRQAPYFLCVLTQNTFSAQTPEEWKDDWVCWEIRTALASDRKILLLMEQGFRFPEDAPEAVKKISDIQGIEGVERGNFLDKMKELCDKLDPRNRGLFAGDVLDWREGIRTRRNACMTDRQVSEHELAQMKDRFGSDLVQALEDGKCFDGKTQIKSIHMSCYAASIIFANGRNMVDDRAYDRGMMFNLFARLLEDEDFFLELIINAPGCFAAQDAVMHRKLGNRALEAYPEAIFYSSYCGVQRLIREDPIFRQAYQDKRFRFLVTEEVMPYALFQIEYKEGYAQYDHIKIDLYSGGLHSNMDRRCMIVFREDDPENYSFFAQRYTALRNVRESRQLIRTRNDEWLAAWEELKEEMD